MQTFLNRFSESTAVVRGMRLAAGATVRATDVYDSTDGRWCKAGRAMGEAGLVIRPGCETVWVRPNARLSEEAFALLACLVQPGDQHFYLTRDSWHWKVVPEPRWAYDGRMDWVVRHPECTDELIDFGFVQLVDGYRPDFGEPYPMYYPTEIGLALIQESRRTH